MVKDIHVPDIGEFSNVEVIDVIVKAGDEIAQEDVLITLETEKATMDIPAPCAGKVVKVHVAPGAKVSKGSLILSVEASEAAGEAVGMLTSTAAAAAISAAATAVPTVTTTTNTTTQVTPTVPRSTVAPAATSVAMAPGFAPALPRAAATVQGSSANGANVYASPAIRRYAVNLGVNLFNLVGTGRKGRILREDVERYVKQVLTAGTGQQQAVATAVAPAGTGLNLLPFKEIDFSKFGAITTTPLSRIKKISGATLQRNWVHVPHVTQFEMADITELEEFRQQQKHFAEQRGVKLTLLIFLLKAVVAGLKKFPQFNVSLNPAGDTLILKHYFHIGVAVDTPHGLVVPVIRNVDSKGLLQLAEELALVSKTAREGKLTAEQMQGGCFSISSLGGIGGTAFTPIINAPEVAILGVSKASLQPVYVAGDVKQTSLGANSGSGSSAGLDSNRSNGSSKSNSINKTGAGYFVARLQLPLSLSYDHRVIDGAEAARFTTFLAARLADIRMLLF